MFVCKFAIIFLVFHVSFLSIASVATVGKKRFHMFGQIWNSAVYSTSAETESMRYSKWILVMLTFCFALIRK